MSLNIVKDVIKEKKLPKFLIIKLVLIYLLKIPDIDLQNYFLIE